MNLDVTGWCVAAGVLVAIELATGTLYVLMIAVGAAAGATSAWVGCPLAAQLIWAAIVGAGATVAWNRYRAKHVPQVPSARNKDVNLDIGEPVDVTEPSPNERGTVRYRGASWQARSWDGAPLSVGSYTIREIEGLCLVLGRRTADSEQEQPAMQ
jgi:membrane protein implicated in regulation of membrane protease activity